MHWFASFGSGDCGVWSAGNAPGCAIPYVIGERRIGPMTLRVAVGAANAYTPQFDVIGPGGPSLADLRQMMRDLEVAMVSLHSLGASSKALSREPTAARFAFADVEWTESAPVIDCTGDWENYFRTRRKSRRSEWLEKEQTFIRTGGELRVLSEWTEVAPRFQEILDVEASGWKGREGSAIKQVPSALAFFRAVCPALAAAGKLRVFLLLRESRIIAFKIGTLHGGRLSSIKTGYLDGFAKDSPGQVLQLLVTRWCFEQPDVAIFDFLSPPTPHKLAWATRSEHLHSLRAYRPSPAGVLAKLRWSTAPRMRAWFDSARAGRERARKGAGDLTLPSEPTRQDWS